MLRIHPLTSLFSLSFRNPGSIGIKQKVYFRFKQHDKYHSKLDSNENYTQNETFDVILTKNKTNMIWTKFKQL